MLIKPPLDIAKAVIKSLADLDSPTRKDLMKVIRKTITGTNYAFPTSIQLWEAYRELLNEGLEKNETIERALRVKDVRTDSGVAPITVLTKPYPCPGKCVYCPTEYRMPKSYISSEPAAARALSLDFDPYEQVKQRVEALERNGHTANKIELIVKGGTWSAYPQDYREWFITRCFEAANELGQPSIAKGDNSPLVKGGHSAQSTELGDSQSTNETASYRIIGLTIETRPDHITPQEVIHLRKLGVTRVELGLQIINDRVLELTGRGTTVADAEQAITLLKAAAFKVDVHILPGQPGASRKDDLESFKTLFDDPRFRPDMIKLYPCVVLPNSELYEQTMRREFKPLEGENLRELLMEMQTMIPYYCRVSRLIRDFPTGDISHGNKQTNLRESIETEMKKRGIHCKCLRCREVGHVPGDHTHDKTQLFEERYENAGGIEVFLSIENEDRSAVFGFCRLRLPQIPQSRQGGISPFDEGVAIEADDLRIHGEILPYKASLKEDAQKLRRNQTLAEKNMWFDVLSKDKTGFRFLRQKPIDSFIADFYCSKLLLIIEVDGKIHDKQKEYDDSRTYCLEDLGLKVIRYTNEEILYNITAVKKDLDSQIQIRLNEIKNLATISKASETPPRQRGTIAQSAIWGIYEAFPILRTSAQIRELHTYGTALNINQQDKDASQHKGYGRKLMARAEEIAIEEGYDNMAVISGIGVREYYKLLGYHEEDTYMVKDLQNSD
ncbi:MAG: tRNA uridine(34) 5-carboxymethylaminomethyl modification radical SAM/GNAT enzyme Elp3 [Patescibacteria group bacterium]|nr:tRNA uridine(34) 5-carboxymethylaminomethyl modification radical SAM/GNAT enzyme Elp3 [Patescibacteria group bacterium]